MIKFILYKIVYRVTYVVTFIFMILKVKLRNRKAKKCST